MTNLLEISKNFYEAIVKAKINGGFFFSFRSLIHMSLIIAAFCKSIIVGLNKRLFFFTVQIRSLRKSVLHFSSSDLPWLIVDIMSGKNFHHVHPQHFSVLISNKVKTGLKSAQMKWKMNPKDFVMEVKEIEMKGSRKGRREKMRIKG